MSDKRTEDLQRFYLLIEKLAQKTGAPRRLADCSGSMRWPRRGVYFFFEPSELRTGSGVGPRVVRVGTHALKSGSKTKLWTRLSQHRGRAKTQGGNHRGSIFRLLVGTALIARDGVTLSTWGCGTNAASDILEGERVLEAQVSQTIGAMTFLALPLDDEPGAESQRGFIERNAIALLSDFGKTPIDPASANWLGRHCNRERVRKSNLWNQNHVDEQVAAEFLDRLDGLIRAADEL